MYSFKRSINTFSVQGNVAYTLYQSASVVNLSSLPNSAEFTSLFDQYRINFVVLKMFLRVSPDAQAAANAVSPRVYWTRDTNSSGVLTQAEMKQRADMRCAVLRPERPVIIKFKPNLLQNVYLSGVANAYEPVYGKYIDTASASAPYYGVLYNVTDFTNTNYFLDIEATFYFQCKNVV